jgi:putative PIN family toxin of toxin-antitoxin system
MIRVVLDTNVVLSALLFTSGRLASIRRAWLNRQLQSLACKETVSELLRALAYLKLKLTAADQHDLLDDFLPYADVVELPRPWPALPVCGNEKDQMFLLLAQVGRAEAHSTVDNDIVDA